MATLSGTSTTTLRIVIIFPIRLLMDCGIAWGPNGTSNFGFGWPSIKRHSEKNLLETCARKKIAWAFGHSVFAFSFDPPPPPTVTPELIGSTDADVLASNSPVDRRSFPLNSVASIRFAVRTDVCVGW